MPGLALTRKERSMTAAEFRRWCTVGMVAGAAVLIGAARAGAADPPKGAVTFTRDVAPIFQDK